MKDRYPDAGAYCTAVEFVMPDGTNGLPNENTVPKAPGDGYIPRYFHNAALEGPTMTCSSTCLTKKRLEEFGLFPGGDHFGRDNDLFGRVALKYDIAFSWTCGAIIHVEASGRISDKRSRTIISPLFIRTGHEAVCRGMVSGQQLNDLKEYLAFLELTAAYRKLYAGQNLEAIRVVLNNHPYVLIKKWFPLLVFSLLPFKAFNLLVHAWRTIMYKTF